MSEKKAELLRQLEALDPAAEGEAYEGKREGLLAEIEALADEEKASAAVQPEEEVASIFSEATYNGYHILSRSDEPEVGVEIARAHRKKGTGMDVAVCRSRDAEVIHTRPWGGITVVPEACQKCKWLYITHVGTHDCLLATKDLKIEPGALVTGAV